MRVAEICKLPNETLVVDTDGGREKDWVDGNSCLAMMWYHWYEHMTRSVGDGVLSYAVISVSR